MVLEVGANSGKILDNGHVELAEERRRPNTAELQDLGRVDGAGSEDDVSLGSNGNPSGVA